MEEPFLNLQDMSKLALGRRLIITVETDNFDGEHYSTQCQTFISDNAEAWTLTSYKLADGTPGHYLKLEWNAPEEPTLTQEVIQDKRAEEECL